MYYTLNFEWVGNMPYISSGIAEIGAAQGLLVDSPKFLIGNLALASKAMKTGSQFKVLFEKMIQNQSLDIIYNFDVDVII